MLSSKMAKMNETVKIGPRALTDTQLKILLPSFKDIYVLIDNFRKEAKVVSDTKEKISNNFISILGGRGSGKTSVMHTVLERMEEIDKDIVLKLIVPERMSKSNDAMGWLLDSFRNEIANLQNKYVETCKNNRDLEGEIYKKCIRKERTPLEEKYNKLTNSYLFRKEQYYSRIQNRDDGLAEYITESKDFAHSDSVFQSEFSAFIDGIVEFKKMSSKSAVEPLVIISFDDVDVSAERCAEVLDLILNYLSYANIVVFVTGEYRVFAEMMAIHFLHKEQIDSRHYKTSFVSGNVPGPEEEAEEDCAIQLRRSRSLEYLKKVLPPSFRFEMNKIVNKGEFFYNVKLEGKSEESDLTLLELMLKIKFGDNPSQKFGEINKDFLGVYLSFFDDNPRGLINAYYFMYRKQDSNWTLDDIFQLITILISSSWQLSEYKNELNSIIRYEAGSITIDYDVLVAIFERRSETNIDEMRIRVHLLVDFTCRMLNCLETKYNIVGNKTSLIKAFNTLNVKTRLFPEIETEEVIKLFSKVSSKLNFSELKSLFNTDSFTLKEQHFYEGLSSNTDASLVDKFEDYFIEDRKWVTSHVDSILGESQETEGIYELERIELIKKFKFSNLRNDNLKEESAIRDSLKKTFNEIREYPISNLAEISMDLEEEVRQYQLNKELIENQLKLIEIKKEIGDKEYELNSIKEEFGGLEEAEMSALISQRDRFLERIGQFQKDVERNS
jgi:exonuclease SbcC